MTFRNSDYAYVVVRSGGAVRYFGPAFAHLQAIWHLELQPRKTYTCTLFLDRLELEPGRYELMAYLNTTNQAKPESRIFTRRSMRVRG